MSKVIVITGATRGLGRALAGAFAAGGHTVIGCGRGDGQVRALRTDFPGPHHFSQVDVTDGGAVAAWAATVLAKFPAPDLLVNNAAQNTPPPRLGGGRPDQFNALLDVNIKGVFNVIRGFVPAMVARKSGVIVNLSSGWGRSTAPEVAPYCATKYAIEGLTLALAQELPKGMAAVPLNPGIIDTDMLRQAFGEGAGAYPKPDAWVKKAAPLLLNLGATDNGRSLSVS
jgi:NAD(P)-dependent dehydrogenase (short-subunit alcohol dehydrogenase family)